MEEVRKFQVQELTTKSGQLLDIEMMEVSLSDRFLDTAECCSVMLRELGMHVAIKDGALNVELYRRSASGSLEQLEEDWPSKCDVLIFPDGAIELEMEAQSGMMTLVGSLGKIRELQMSYDQEPPSHNSMPRMR